MKINCNPAIQTSRRRGQSLCLSLIVVLFIATTAAKGALLLSEDSHLEWIPAADTLLSSRGAAITSVTRENEDLSGNIVSVSGGVETSLESGILIEYSWGSFQLEWLIDGGVATALLTLTNTSDTAIADFSISLLRWEVLDSQVSTNGFTAFTSDNLDKAAYHSWEVAGSRLTAGLPSIDPPLKIIAALTSDNEEPPAWTVRLAGGVHRMDDGGITYPMLGSARIEPGESLSFQLLLKESSTDIDQEIVESVFRSKLYRDTKHSSSWPDRRPIGMLFLTAKHSQSNPKGLFWDENLDSSDPEAVLASAISYAENAVSALQEIHAQGAIAWDIEGTDLPISFVGDPRMLPILNPAMDQVADAFFKVFTDAGLHIGVTLRPTQVYFNESSNQWSHGTGSHGPDRNPLSDNFDSVWPDGLPWWRFYPLVERLDRKIQYAKDRWGCRLFYIDTNGVFRETTTPGAFPFILLDASVIRELMDRHPDILLVPELEKTNSSSGTHLAYWGACAPYGELDLGDKGTPAWIRDTYPHAFSVINVSDGNIEADKDALIDAVRSGDILFCRGWFKDSRNQLVNDIYQEAFNQ